MEDIILEIAKYLSVFIIGAFVHYLTMNPKITKLTNEIQKLIDTVQTLTIRIETVDQLRSDLFALEKRVSDNDAHIKYNSQDIR